MKSTRKPSFAPTLADLDQGKKPARKYEIEERSFVETMPDDEQLRTALKGKFSDRKQQILDEISKSNKKMAGMLTVNEAADRYDEERAKNIGKVNEYARNFSEIADVVHPVGGRTNDAMW